MRKANLAIIERLIIWENRFFVINEELVMKRNSEDPSRESGASSSAEQSFRKPTEKVLLDLQTVVKRIREESSADTPQQDGKKTLDPFSDEINSSIQTSLKNMTSNQINDVFEHFLKIFQYHIVNPKNTGVIKTLKLFIESSADSNTLADGYAPLHLAALRRDIDLMRYLLEHHADVNIETLEHKTSSITYLGGFTPLYIELAYPLCQTAFIKHGNCPPPSYEDLPDRSTAINKEIYDLLRSHGAYILGDTNSRHLSAIGCILTYVQTGPEVDATKYFEFALRLVAAGANINEQNHNCKYFSGQKKPGFTLLHMIILHRTYSLLPQYLEAGSDPTIKNNRGETALDLLTIHLRAKEVENAIKQLKRAMKKPSPTSSRILSLFSWGNKKSDDVPLENMPSSSENTALLEQTSPGYGTR